MASDQLLPHDVDAEEAVLGSMLIDSEAIISVSLSLKAQDFYRERNAWVYGACLALYEKGEWFHAEPFPDLEDQQCSYTGEPGESSPDRMDAHVWGVTELKKIGESTWGQGSWGGSLAAATA